MVPKVFDGTFHHFHHTFHRWSPQVSCYNVHHFQRTFHAIFTRCIPLFLLYVSPVVTVLFFFFLILFKKKYGIDKSTEWSPILACPSLTCFSNRGDTEGTNSSKMLCPMFVYVLFYVGLCHG